jgi:large subunit ribosomal protein L4
MKTDVYNIEGKVVGSVELPENVFGIAWKPGLVHDALRVQRNSARAPLAHAKGRGEVSGGGKKPWRQKGTGRARHGSIRSPLWKGGGASHGPNKSRVFDLKMNKKERKLALRSLLSEKFRGGEIYVVESLHTLAPKTKELAGTLRILFNAKKDSRAFSAVIVPPMKNESLYRAARNLPKVATMPFGSLNVYDALIHKRIVIDREALAEVK